MLHKFRTILTLKSYILFAILFLLSADPLTVAASPRVQPVSGDKVVIVIDPGHGGDNEGTKENGVLEKAMTLKTATAMYNELKKYDNAEVYLTRTEDTGLSMVQRAEFAQSVNADFLFSIHYNASLSHEMYGSEVWIPLNDPYRSYGYQFGCVQMETMQDMGLFLRGVKTRPGDKGDYYGIIRESAALSIPAVIIEHCHVDNAVDMPYCDSDDDLTAFGRADALSVAKYFGLYSTELGVDYRDYSSGELADPSPEGSIRICTYDTTEPEICRIELNNVDYDTGKLTLGLTAADYDGMILYYDYSIDGGATYSEKLPWPGCNVFTGEYYDTPEIIINIPSKTKPDITLRAYNLFDLYTESNTLSLDEFLYGEDAVKANSPAVAASEADVSGIANDTAGTTTFQPDVTAEEQPKEVSFASFLAICLIIAVLLPVTAVIVQLVSDHRRRHRRHYSRNVREDSRYHRK